MHQRAVETRRVVVFLVVLAGIVSCSGATEPVLEPAEWNFGTIPATLPVEQGIAVHNPGRRRIEVNFISTCDCLTVEPNRLDLAGGGEERVTLRYDPSEDEGKVEMQVIVRTGQGTAATRQMFRVFGGVLPREPPAESAGQPILSPTAQRLQLSFEYFYDSGCKGCEIFLVRQMIALQQELQIRLRVTRLDIGKPEVYQLYTRKLVAFGIEERAYPAVVFADVVLQGDEEIEREFKKVLQRHLDSLRDSSNP
jgi:hypothetical protein